jgi:hypothetical protein
MKEETSRPDGKQAGRYSANQTTEKTYGAGNFWCPIKLTTQVTTSNVFARLTASTTNNYAMAQLDEAMCYNPEGRGFDSRRCHSHFSLI